MMRFRDIGSFIGMILIFTCAALLSMGVFFLVMRIWYYGAIVSLTSFFVLCLIFKKSVTTVENTIDADERVATQGRWSHLVARPEKENKKEKNV